MFPTNVTKRTSAWNIFYKIKTILNADDITDLLWIFKEKIRARRHHFKSQRGSLKESVLLCHWWDLGKIINMKLCFPDKISSAEKKTRNWGVWVRRWKKKKICFFFLSNEFLGEFLEWHTSSHVSKTMQRKVINKVGEVLPHEV